MTNEHRRYTGPLRWDVCAECKEPWPCGPAVFQCELDTITAELTPQCTAERPFGPCTQRCEQSAGHDGQHRAQCFTWDDTSWTQTDDTGETVAAVSHAGKIDLTQVYTGPITDNQYVELFLRGEFYVVREDQP